MIVDVGDTMFGKHVSVARSEESCVANFDGIGEVFWELLKEPIQSVDEVYRRHPVSLKLKKEGTRVRLELRFSVGSQHEVLEQLGIEEPWVWLSGAQAITSLHWIARDREFLPDRTAHVKVFGNLSQVTPELIRGRWATERRIISYCPEKQLTLMLILAVFAEAFSRKAALGIESCVDLSSPAFIGPC